LRVYWDANARGKKVIELKGFEERLVRDLEELIRNESADFRIIKGLKSSYAASLRCDFILLLPEKKRTNDNSMRLIDRMGIGVNSIRIIDNILELCHDEKFKRQVFSRIFDSSESERDSKYLTDCVLRILVEEHSIDFLAKLPIQSFVRCVMDKYGQQITQALERDFENHKEIFDNLQKFMRELLLQEIGNVENFRTQSLSGENSNQLELK
jgi:hypothetical protein